MNRPRQQHYVTKAYLDGFLPAGEGRLWVYSRGRLTAFRAAPENIAKIHNWTVPSSPFA